MSSRLTGIGHLRAPVLRRALRYLAAAWALAFFAFAAAMPASADKAKPDGLRVEYAERPLGLDEPSPRLSWLSSASKQTAYQIRVATSAAGLTKAQLVWDSGRVESGDSVLIPYTGPALGSRQRYWWQVRVWDAKGCASPWSAAEWWEMGLLAPGDWSAKWIAGPDRRDHDWSDFTFDTDLTLTGASLDILFRARPVGKTFGEAYVWRLEETNAGAALVQMVRHYPGGSSSAVKTVELKRIPLAGLTLRNQRHTVRITAAGQRITTSIDNTVVDVTENGEQSNGTIGFWSRDSKAAVIHGVRITPARGGAGASFETRFAANDNPFTGGRVVADGLAVASGVPSVDIVLPMDAPAPLVRSSFRLTSKSVAQARLYVAGAGWPKLSLNAKPVGPSAMGVGFTAYDKRVLTYTYDVTGLLRSGENVLGAELGRGWYGVTDPNEWYFQSAPWRNEPALRAQLEITFKDGSRQTIVTDESWLTKSGPTLSDSVHRGERYDARLLPAGWNAPSFKPADWTPAQLVAGPTGVFAAANAEHVAPVGAIEPLSFKEVAPGVWVYDFGRIFSGWTELTVSGKPGLTVSLTASERIDDRGEVVPASGLIDAQLQTDRYTTAGRGVERWAPSFGYRGFRYVQLEGFPGKPTLKTLKGFVVHSSVARIGKFDSASALLGKIDAAGINSILNNMHGYQTDTPTYEKNGWTGDAQGSAGAAARALDVSRIWTKWLADFRDAQAANGEMPEIVPATPEYGYENTPGWSYVWGPTTPWDVATMILPWELYQTHGDTRILAAMHDAQKRLVDYTAEVFGAPDYFHNKGLSEWSAPGGMDISNARGGGVDAVTSAYLFLEADLLAKSSSVIGKSDDAARYRALADDVRNAYNKRHWDEAERRYRTLGADGKTPGPTQTQNVLPLAFGMVPDGADQSVADWLAQDVSVNGIRTGVYGTRYLLEVLSDYGHADVAYATATREQEPSWGWWIANGHGSMFERWDLQSRSRDHHYFASISDWMRQRLAGLRPGEPGYKTVLIKPDIPEGLAWASATMETPYGHTAAGWRRGGGEVTLTAEIPANASGEVWAPLKLGRVNNAPASARLLRETGTHAVYSVGPGKHTFTIRGGS